MCLRSSYFNLKGTGSKSVQTINLSKFSHFLLSHISNSQAANTHKHSRRCTHTHSGSVTIDDAVQWVEGGASVLVTINE